MGRSPYGIPGARPRPRGGNRAGKIAAAVILGLIASGIVSGLGAPSAVAVLPLAFALWRAVDPRSRQRTRR